LTISEENIKILKKISNAKSGLSKKKMDEFSGEMTKYGQLMVSPKEKAAVIDQLFYSNFKLGMIKDRAQTFIEKNQGKFTSKKLKNGSNRKIGG